MNARVQLVSYAAPATDEIYSVAFNCTNGATYTSAAWPNVSTQLYEIVCFTGVRTASQAALLTAYTFEERIDACTGRNIVAVQNYGAGEARLCKVLFHSVLHYSGFPSGLNCWLHGPNSTGAQAPAYSGAPGMEKYSALAYLH